jgi:hypothetical protein
MTYTNDMKLLNLNPLKRILLTTTAVLAAGILPLMPRLLTAQPSPNAPPTGVVANLVPLRLGSSIPLAVQSAGVAWKGSTFHLVRLGSITFDLDQNDCLKADIQAGLTGFDNVDYDISGAVFDAAGQMLGSARAPCKVQRLWRRMLFWLVRPTLVLLAFNANDRAQAGPGRDVQM